MIKAVGISLQGLQTAQSQAVTAASEIARGAQTYRDTAGQGGYARPNGAPQGPAPGRPLVDDASLRAAPDLVSSTVDLIAAEHAYKANAKVLSSLAETSRTLIDELL